MVVDVEVAKDQQGGIQRRKQNKRMNSPKRGRAGHCAVGIDDPEELVGGVNKPPGGVKVQGHDVGFAVVDRKQGAYL